MKLPHDSAHTHVTGQSEYVDDRPLTKGELFLEVLYSQKAHAKILSISFSEAEKVPGFVRAFTGKDFAENRWGTIFKDQPLLAESEVQFVGEAIAFVAAETQEAARRAKEKITVHYQDLAPILSISEARRQKSFLGSERSITKGNVEAALKKSPHRLRGKLVIQGADHFYLESQVSVAYPREDGQIEIHSSTQHPTETQHVASHALGLAAKDVVCVVKRMGGAFGGKESQAAPFAAYAALAAQKLNRPARIVLTKDDDMIMTGKRNPFEVFYEVGFDHDGHLLALDAQLFSDSGAYADLSTSIMERAMLHSDNAYFIPNMRVVGQVCRTNFHPHTAFRGFGGPKGVAMIEKAVEEVAHFLGKDALKIRKLNCYSPEGGRNTTHYGQEIKNNCLPELFSSLEKDCEYASRRKEIQLHNELVLSGKKNAPLRGLSLTPVKFGISFTTRFLNQANSLVLVHRDGTVQVSTGATEMGQGVNARIAQMVAEEFGIPRGQVRVMATATDKNANTSPTAASSGTDLNGAAAVLAARKIKYRLSLLAEKLFHIPESKWARHTAGLGTEPEIEVGELGNNIADPNLDTDWPSGTATYRGVVFAQEEVRAADGKGNKLTFAALVNEAYHHRISLSDYAFYKFSGIAFNKLTGQGDAFLYFTQGVAASEVSVDRDTGEVKVGRVDILMDLGRPVNEGLDIGQVTGGFIQGMGWVTTENLFYSPEGKLLSHSPSTYKIPSIQDTPRVFRTKLIHNEENFPNVRGTKAAGEPPLLLALSVWTAVHDALKQLPSFRKTLPVMKIPATQEEVLRALYADRFAHLEAGR